MAENKEYMIHQEEDGAIQISEDVVASIASTTASEVEGVSARIVRANVDLPEPVCPMIPMNCPSGIFRQTSFRA